MFASVSESTASPVSAPFVSAIKVFLSRYCFALLIFLSLLPLFLKLALMFFVTSAKFSFAVHSLLLVSLFLGPGLAVRPFVLRHLPSSLAARLIWITLFGLFCSVFLVWVLYVFGLYTVIASRVLALLLIGSLFFGVARFPWCSSLRGVFVGISRLHWLDKTGLAFLVWVLSFSALRSLEPFSTWDALVSWDKWGRDMALREGLGGYVTGAYPQLIPSLYSLQYKLFALPASRAIPDVTYFAHAANGVFDWLLLPGALLLCRRLGASLLLFAAFFSGSSIIIEWFGSGYVDTATTALFISVAALAVDWISDSSSSGLSGALLRFLPAGATLCFVKGQGVVLMFVAALCLLCRRFSVIYVKVAVAVIALTAGFLLTLPYTLHQHHVWESGAAETAIGLHTMPVRIKNPAVEPPTISRALKLAREFNGSYRLPFGIASHTSATGAGVLLTVGVILSLRKRQIRPLVVAAAAGWLLWFYLSSYDWRNAMQIGALWALCAAAGFRIDFMHKGLAGAAALFECLLALALCGNALVFMRTTPIFSQPRLWTLSPEERPSSLFGPRFDLLASSPLAIEARHIFTQNTDVWFLGEKAVYLWHPFAERIVPQSADIAAVFRDHSGDIASSHRQAFEPISGFQTQIISMVRPLYRQVSATLSGETSPISRRGLPVRISESGVYWLDAAISACGGDVAMYDIEVASADYSKIRMVVGREWNEVTSYRKICNFVRDGCSYRVLLWLDRIPKGEPLKSLPPLALEKLDERPVEVKSANVMIISASASNGNAAP